MKIRWFGHAGHFICAPWCRFHLCTQVGEFLISTVGEYVPDAPVREIMAQSRGIKLEGRGDARLADYMNKRGFEQVGCDRLYETMVFRAGRPCDAEGCNCGLPSASGEELDFGGYNDAKSATEGHYKMIEKWSLEK
jgi:hypothetical protein